MGIAHLFVYNISVVNIVMSMGFIVRLSAFTVLFVIPSIAAYNFFFGENGASNTENFLFIVAVLIALIIVGLGLSASD